MKDEKDFDNAVKAKLESRVYTPDENSWAAAEKLILEQEAAGRSGFGKYFLGLLAACGVLAVTGWFLLYSPEGNGNSKTAAASQQNDTQHSDGNNDAATNPYIKSAAPAADNNSTRPNGQSSAPQNMSNIPGKANPPATNTNENPAVNNASATPGKTRATDTGNKNAGVADSSPKTKRGGKKTSPGKTPVNAVATNTNTAGQQSTGTTAGGTIGANASGQTPTATIVEEDVRTAGMLTNKKNQQPADGNGNSTGDAQAVATVIKDSAAETVAAKPFIVVTTQETNDQESLTGSVKTGASSSSTSKEDPTTPYWFLRGGVAYMPGFESTTTVGRSINPVLGGGYSYSLTKRLRIEAGLQYTSIGKASDSSRIYTSQNFGFGLEQERTEIGLQRLHYVAMPIQLRIAFGRKNALLAGVTPHYLFTAESRVRTYTLSHSTITNDKTTRVFGYNQGLRSTDLLLGAGYARTISDRLDVAAVFNFGLTDIKDNAYFRFEKTERHKNLQLLLRYKF
jgi:hypothetical protein